MPTQAFMPRISSVQKFRPTHQSRKPRPIRCASSGSCPLPPTPLPFFVYAPQRVEIAANVMRGKSPPFLCLEAPEVADWAKEIEMAPRGQVDTTIFRLYGDHRERVNNKIKQRRAEQEERAHAQALTLHPARTKMDDTFRAVTLSGTAVGITLSLPAVASHLGFLAPVIGGALGTVAGAAIGFPVAALAALKMLASGEPF